MERMTKTREKTDLATDMSSITFDEKGWMHFKAKSISSDFLETEWQKYAAEDSVGKHFLYRHRIPSDPEHSDEPYYGRVLASEAVTEGDKGFIVSDYVVKNTVKRQRKLQELIKGRQALGKPMGISMHYDVYRLDGKIVDLDVVEHSSTWNPADKSAVVLEEDIKMPDDKDKKKEQTKAEDQEVEEALDEIQKELDNKDIRKLELEIQAKKREVERISKEYESFKQDIGKKFEEVAKQIVELTAYNARLEKAPIIAEIWKLEEDEYLRDDVYPSWEKEKLEKRLEYVKAKPRLATVTAETADQTADNEIDKGKVKNEVAKLLSNALSEEELKKMGLMG